MLIHGGRVANAIGCNARVHGFVPQLHPFHVGDAPLAWNCLSTDLKTLHSTPAFKRSLKTFLFRAAYNV